MKTITKTYKIYKFNELNEIAKEKVLEEQINFYMDCIPYKEMSENMQKACNKAENMYTPWFTGSYIYDYCKDELIEDIKINKYTFLSDGTMFNE